MVFTINMMHGRDPSNKQVDILTSKNQALCEFCTHLNQLKHC